MEANWEDHVQRRELTLEVMDLLPKPGTAADLSCGDAYFAKDYLTTKWYLGDFAPGYTFEGPIEQTIDLIPPVHLFMLCETLEHLDDPQLVLAKIRAKAHYMVLSTPLLDVYDENPQHYWAWDDEAVRQMVELSGWTVEHFRRTEPDVGYVFQIWGLS